MATRFLTVALALALVDRATATNHILREDQLMAGFNGDPAVQYIVITVGGNDQKAWGPQGAEAASRAMLVFFNSNGVQTGTFFFPNNPPQGDLSVLIATTNFASLPGAPIPDILIPPLIQPGSGKVVFRGNPANPFRFDVNLVLSYGNFPANLTEGAGSPAPALPLSGEPVSLTRVQNFSFGNGSSRNADFALISAVPINTRGQTFTFPVDGPEIDASASSINFGGLNIAAGATAARTVTLTSRGTVNPLVISNIFLTGAHSNDFQITGGGESGTLAPGATRNVTLTFDPSAVGNRTAALRITSNDTNEPITDIVLTGLGIDPNAPDIDAGLTNIDFGTRDIALGAGASIGQIIANLGTIGTLVISNLSLAGANTNDFRIFSDTGQSSLGPGASRALSLIFTPTSAGPKSAVLRVVSNDPDEGLTLVPIAGFAFDLNPCTAPNPTNSVAQDAATNAMLVCPGLEFSGTLPPTAADGQSSCASTGGDAWFRYVPAASGTLTVNLQGIGMVPVLSAHSAVPGTVGNQLACQSSSGSDSTIAQVTLAVTAGDAVYLRAAAAGSAPGSQFRLALAGPACFDFDRNRNGTTDTCESDFGSAPAPYPTTMAQNGPRHRAFTGVFLGARIDPNDDGVPSVGATGDKLDGPENDEDGVTWSTPLAVGQPASLNVIASTNGFLNAWIDFNADGDWADAGEQILTNRTLVSGPNTLTIPVPAGATPTNRTYARFRFSSAAGLGVTGAAGDGEVEDYALEILPVTVTPGTLQVRINEVMAGLNGDSTVQFVELEVNADADRLWGPQGGETAGRAMLAFFDETGAQIGRYVFRSNAPAGGNTVLVATRAFAGLTGLQPDFIIPPELSAIGGKVTFMANPDNLRFSMNIALSYGGSRYFGLTGGAGPANTNEVPILGARSLARTANFGFGLNQNAGFALGAPTPRNTAGQTVSLTEAPLKDQGQTLFTRETFRGNGRTCATCHIDSKRDQFGLTPLAILDLPEDDPLFVFEHNVNTMRLVLRSQPSDLRGPLTGTLGGGRVLAGSADTFLIVGGTNLAGLISDTNGNVGILQTITQGNLIGPTPGNGSPRGLEDHSLLEHGRGLILENIDGFKRREVFRASPHLLNLELTAPYGLSGEFGTLDEFSLGAVVQHFPRTLARVSGLDFRQPTPAELAAMTMFMNTISQPTDHNYDLDRFATTEAQKRGRTMFFNNEGKCSKCHSGPALNLADGSLFGSVSNVNANFNTGVANLLRNIADGLPTEPAGLPSGQSTRDFSTPTLFGARFTAPFFHDGSAATLKDAVEFYDSEEFFQSPAGLLTGTILAANRDEKVADMVAFLESLVETPVTFTRRLAFGVRCPGVPVQGPLTATVTNIGSVTVSLTNVFLNGTNAAEFSIVADTGETKLSPGQTRSVTVAFNPVSTGGKNATVEFNALETNLLGRFDFAVALTAGNVDNIVTAAPSSLNFGIRDIDAPSSPEVSVVVTNDGSTALDLSGFTVTGATPQDFVVTADTSPLAPHDTRVIQVSFAPRSQGAKSASIRIPVLACNTTFIDIPLSGAASSSVHHFGWDPLATTQYVGTAFAARVTAQDRNNDTVAAFGGTVRLMSVGGAQTNTVVIAPTNSAPFVNGVWNGSITVQQPASSARLLARDNQGHAGLSGAFLAPLRDDLSLVVTDSPDPVQGGQPVIYTFIVHNTGPTEATGVVLTNLLPGGVSFASATSSQGTITHNAGVVTWQVASLGRGLTATGAVAALPLPGFGFITNVASLVRNELESNLANNRATNVTALQAAGLLSVTPGTNFQSSGLSGGPFTPVSQVFVVSNAGNATMTWQARSSGCTQPSGLVAWWPGEGDARDIVGTNHGTLQNGATFAPGMVGQGFLLDGVNDFVLVPDGPALDLTNGVTVELWYKAHRFSPSDALFDKRGIGGACNYGANLSTVFGLEVYYNDPTLSDGDFPDSGFEISALPPPLPATNVFHHFAATYRQVNSNLIEVSTFVDGVVVRTRAMQGNLARTANDAPLSIGTEGPGAPVFAGIIDEVSIYNRPLDPAEIQTIFQAGVAGKCQNPVGASNCTPPPGMVAWWPGEGDATDIVSANHGSLQNGATFAPGMVGQGFQFDGENDFVLVPDSQSLRLTNELTMEMWFKGTSPNWGGLIDKRGGGRANYGFFISPGDVQLYYDQGGGFAISSSALPTLNEFHHIAGTYQQVTPNSIELKTYLDGQLVRTEVLSGNLANTVNDTPVAIGGVSGSCCFFQGVIDEISLYSRALTAAEIQGIFNAGASGKCRSQSWLSQSQFSGTLTPEGRTNVMVTINTNANALAVGSYSATLQFTNTSHGHGSTTRTVGLQVLNRPPTLNALAPLTVAEDASPRTVTLGGVTAGGIESQQLSITAGSGNPLLITNPILVNYTSPATTGSVVLAFVPNAHGTAVVFVVVRDDAGTSGGGRDAVTNSFTVTVTPVNDAPVLSVPGNQTVLPAVPMNFHVTATDGDLPPNALSFTLAAGSPAGASLNPTTGLFSWTPPATPLPGTNVFTFVVTDNGLPPLSDQRSVTLVVVPQPGIQSVIHNAGMVTIRWSATAGLRYRLQFKTTLDDAAWTDVASDVPATGPTAALSVTTGGTQRFYRVLVLP